MACNVFAERRQPVAGWSRQHMREILQAHDREDELDAILSRHGNSFIAMSDDLLGRVGGPRPEADAVFLAYQAPDLLNPEVAGFYLAQRFTGSPVPLSVAEQGPGAAFTALRIADVMWRLGELRCGALFAYDQNAALWEEEEEVQSRPDSAVLLLLGASASASASADASARVEELAERTTRDPAAVLLETLGRHPEEQVLAGRALTERLGGLASHRRVVPEPGRHLFTSAWMSLASRWPLTGPVLIADFDPCSERLYTCRLVPETLP
jgi:hypothetical protein